jgi:hypothetical protein
MKAQASPLRAICCGPMSLRPARPTDRPQSVIGSPVVAARDPPFSTLRTMIVRLVVDIQNRLFWPVGTGLASQWCVLSADGGRHPEMGSDVPAEQRLHGFESLRCCGRRS